MERIAPTYARATSVFLRLLGLVYVLAFASLAAQIVGLAGHDGILPARLYMAAARSFAASEQLGVDRFRILPTLCWIGTSDLFLQGLCLAGAALGALLAAGIAPIAILPILWLDYLSLTVVGRDFLSFQWDALLLETGLLAVALAPLAWRDRWSAPAAPPRVAVWLMLWLLFRLMLGSGLVKLASGDPTWRSLTALLYHYETQPIPTPLAWYAHQMPDWFQKASTLATFFIELAVPFFVLGPRRLRWIAFVLLVGLQAVIAATGNYAFFNLLTASLCVFVLDDEMLAAVWRRDRRAAAARDAVAAQSVRRRLARARNALAIAIAVITVPVSAVAFTRSVGLPLPLERLVAPLERLVEPLRSVNSYGLFAVMTTTRPEIIVEGSDDGATWLPYEFKYKPGDPRRRPPWVAPHQPRLDWQMWFAALGRYQGEEWFRAFCIRLLEGSPDVRRLLAHDPFAGRSPKYLRGDLYRYHFSDWEMGRREGVWWTRERLGDYSPPLSLGTQPSR
jgi:hypothetical protein